MVFKSISGTLDKKKKDILQAGEKNSDVSIIFNKFLNEYFYDYKNLFEWEASYNSRDGKVIINTSSKLVAGELSLRIKELAKLLKEANLKITQIVIV